MAKSLRKERVQPTLVVIDGKRQMISTGHWNDQIILQYVLEHGRAKWIPIRDLAKTAFGNGSPRNQTRARQCISKLHKSMIAVGELLVVSTEGSHHRASAVKVCDYNSPLEVQTAQERLRALHQRRVLTNDQFERALMIFQTHIKPAETS
jgi:hypothetical protein